MALAANGASGIGRFPRLRSVQLGSVLGFKPDSSKQVLPISEIAARHLFTYWAAGVLEERRDGSVDASVGVILALNY